MIVVSITLLHIDDDDEVEWLLAVHEEVDELDEVDDEVADVVMLIVVTTIDDVDVFDKVKIEVVIIDLDDDEVDDGVVHDVVKVPLIIADDVDYILIYLERAIGIHLEEMVPHNVVLLVYADDEVLVNYAVPDAMRQPMVVDEVEEVVELQLVQNDEIDVNEYSFLDIHQVADMISHDELSMSVIDTASIALQVIEL